MRMIFGKIAMLTSDPEGPAKLPTPTPRLHKAAMAAENDVWKSNPLKESAMAAMMISTKKSTTKIKIDIATVGEISLPS